MHRDRFPGGADAREIDLEGGAFADLAIHPDIAFALLDDAVHGGKPKPGALGTLGGEKRLEDVRLGLGVHAHAHVADGQHHVLPRLHRSMGAGVAFVERGIGGFDGELAAAAAWHRGR